MIGTFIFPDDNLSIVDPTILSINEKSMTLNNVTKTISVDVVLIDRVGTKAGPLEAFSNIPRDSDNWDDCDLVEIVTKRLNEYKANSQNN